MQCLREEEKVDFYTNFSGPWKDIIIILIFFFLWNYSLLNPEIIHKYVKISYYSNLLTFNSRCEKQLVQNSAAPVPRYAHAPISV